ncbi:MAG: class A beta-lactamase-related serine hydrolase [Bacteroidetes bacterium]|nr:MAG: class A beta-lactamase-related serine hydrolase [Bacteroidota bacterium]
MVPNFFYDKFLAGIALICVFQLMGIQHWFKLLMVAALACSGFGCGNNSMARKPAYVNQRRVLDSSEQRKYSDSLQYFFDALLNKKGFSGGILVAKNGVVLYEHYQGFTNAAKTDSIDAETPFHVASTSKTFTSTAIMQLVRSGKLALNDSIQTFFKDFPYKGVTIKHLLNHSSGLPYYANFMLRYGWNKNITATNADVLNTLHNHQPPLDFPTGTAFKYSNTNFVLLALVVEKVSGQYFPTYVKDSIFTPAGMLNSYILNPTNTDRNMMSWSGSGRPYNFEYLDAIYGDKNVFTTCRDLMRYDSAIAYEHLLPATYLQQAWTPYFRDGHYRDSIEHYGLGWRLKVFNDSLKIPYHNGWWHGNNAVFQRLIADTAVIIVTGNRMNNRIYSAPMAANVFRPYFNVSFSEMEALQETIDTPLSKRPLVLPSTRNAAKKVVNRSSKKNTRKPK